MRIVRTHLGGKTPIVENHKYSIANSLPILDLTPKFSNLFEGFLAKVRFSKTKIKVEVKHTLIY